MPLEKLGKMLKPAAKVNKVEMAKSLCQRCWSTRDRDYSGANLSKDLRELSLLQDEKMDLLDWLPIGGGGTTGDRVRAVHGIVTRVA